jgi:TolB protein
MAADCTPDGRLAVRASVRVSTNLSRLTITGGGAPEGAIEVPGIVQGVSLSPDGRRVALNSYDGRTSTSGLWLVDVATGQLSSLPGGPGPTGPPRWSPDGGRLLFFAAQGDESLAYVLEIGQAEPVQLFERPGVLDSDWSPDGKTLVFSAQDANSLFQLFEANTDGSGERQLTTSDTSKSSPLWAEDGSTIAFAGTVVVPQVSRVAISRHNVAVWLVNADGSGERALTDVALDAWPLAWCLPGPWLEGWTEE